MVQVYRAQELKVFERVTLAPNENRRMRLTLTADDISTWDADRHAWQVRPGRYELRVGRSLRDTALTAWLNVHM